MLQEVLSLDQMLTDAVEAAITQRIKKIWAVLTVTIYTFSTCDTVWIVRAIIS